MKTLTALILFAVISCSSEKCIKNNSDLIEINQFECWLNLMPGGKPSFHYSGEILLKSKKINFDFKKIEFIAGDKSLHNSKPILEDSDETFIEDKQVCLFRFYSQQNLPVSDEMIKVQLVDVKLFLFVDDKPIQIVKRNIQLQRVY